MARRSARIQQQDDLHWQLLPSIEFIARAMCRARHVNEEAWHSWEGTAKAYLTRAYPEGLRTMKLLRHMKDGGPLSKVWGFFLIEWKRLFSVAVLQFDHGARDAYHTHAFNAVSWVLWGKLVERTIWGETNVYTPSFRPIFTPRDMFHKVESVGVTWAITFRGPWVKRWTEWLPDELRFVSLTNGRKVVNEAVNS